MFSQPRSYLLKITRLARFFSGRVITGANYVDRIIRLECLQDAGSCKFYIVCHYRRVDDLNIGHAYGSYQEKLLQLSKKELLHLGLEKLNTLQYSDLLEVMEDRYTRGGTIIISQLPITEWCKLVGNGDTSYLVCAGKNDEGRPFAFLDVYQGKPETGKHLANIRLDPDTVVNNISPALEQEGVAQSDSL